ncbi:AraC family transcriptional regulator [Halomonas sp. Bachu 37]|uniref:helix-turn-helix transcriptional regulator n=1 Tax=Halomonas kashgarensis TaxID=3084920 RepID=UPI0032176FDA
MFHAMTRAEIWLQEALESPLSIDELAKHLGYSSSQVRRQFRHCFNVSPSKYREKRRLERAAVLLAYSPQNIAHIAQRCGYSNHSSFSRAFQRQYALSPRGFRQAIFSRLKNELAQTEITATIEKSRPGQALTMRLYQAPESIDELGSHTQHCNAISCFQSRLQEAVPIVLLPDALASSINAVADHAGNSAAISATNSAAAISTATNSTATNSTATISTATISLSTRTDIGVYVKDDSIAESIALPVPYRRQYIPSHYHASTVIQEIDQLKPVLQNLLNWILFEAKGYYLSGEPPCVLWHGNGIEIRVPLSSMD